MRVVPAAKVRLLVRQYGGQLVVAQASKSRRGDNDGAWPPGDAVCGGTVGLYDHDVAPSRGGARDAGGHGVLLAGRMQNAQGSQDPAGNRKGHHQRGNDQCCCGRRGQGSGHVEVPGISE